ncbi:MAG: hypothetical protein WAM58_23415 [Candidatus Acidiferrum sp.]
MPVIVTDVATAPEVGEMLVMFGAAVPTSKPYGLLATPPTVTTTLPVVAPVGTGTLMEVALQLVGVPVVPLNVTVLVPCDVPKFVPVIVTEVPTTPAPGVRLLMLGSEDVTVKRTLLLFPPPTETRRSPVAAPAGTATVIDVSVELIGLA